MVRLQPDPDTVIQKLDDELILVHLRTNKVYALNETGARLWALIEDGCDRDSLRDELLGEFDVDEAQLALEIEAILGELLEAGLIAQSE